MSADASSTPTCTPKYQNQKIYFHCSNKKTIANKKIYKTNDVQYKLSNIQLQRDQWSSSQAAARSDLLRISIKNIKILEQHKISESQVSFHFKKNFSNVNQKIKTVINIH